MVEVEKVICPHNSPLKLKKGEAIDIDHRLTQQECTTLFPLKGLWVVERPVVWHVQKRFLKTSKIRPKSGKIWSHWNKVLQHTA